MHEQSLVGNLLKQVDEIRSQHNAQRVTEVRVELGPLSGVEPLLLASAFELLKPDTPAANAKLVIDEVQLLAQCESCHNQFEINDFVFHCPTCDGNVKVVCGDQFCLVSISFPEEASQSNKISDPRSLTEIETR